VAGVLLGALLPSLGKLLPVVNTPATGVDKVEHTNSYSSGNAYDTYPKLTMEDLGLGGGLSDGKKVNHYTLDVIIESEDPEYWEIEQLDGNFYRVRREDYDDDFYGHYEFDTEECIGNLEDLYKYAKDHHIRPR
jgi:hypothetical protein